MYYTVYILYIFTWKGAQIGCTIDMKIGWALDLIGWACAQPFPTLATPLSGSVFWYHLPYEHQAISYYIEQLLDFHGKRYYTYNGYTYLSVTTYNHTVPST